MDNIVALIDENGVIENVDDGSVVVQMQQGDRIVRKRQMDVIIQKNIERQFKDQFIWILFKYGEKLLPNISSANLTRLMYAATFCNNDGSLMSIEDLKTKMKLSKNRWYEFWKEVTDNNILFDVDGVVYANGELFSRGKIQTESNYTRLFCDCVRDLYEGCDNARQHKQLSYLFKAIPFVNRMNNSVCANQQEQDEVKIKCMTVGELCDVVGYSRNQANRLMDELSSITVDGEQMVVYVVKNRRQDKSQWAIVVNPKLYFGGRRTNLIFNETKELFLKSDTIQN